MANRIIEELTAWGCDTTGALNRMLNDEEFYISLLVEFMADGGFKQLGADLAAGDVQAAFDSAHTLKGWPPI